MTDIIIERFSCLLQGLWDSVSQEGLKMTIRYQVGDGE